MPANLTAAPQAIGAFHLIFRLPAFNPACKAKRWADSAFPF